MYQATRTGLPIMRALIFGYPDDASLSDMWDEYLYGSEILVAPVDAPKATERKVYLPAGRWISYDDKRMVYEGKATITATAALGTIPLFAREGAIIPRGDIVKLNNNWDANWGPKLRIEVFPSAAGASEFDYYTGSFVRPIKVVPRQDEVIINFGDLGVTGTLEVYCRSAREVKRNGTVLREGSDYHFDAQRQELIVAFQGATDLEIEGTASLFESASSPKIASVQ